MMLAYSLILEGTVSGESRQDFREDLTRIWERLESPVSGLPKSHHLGIFCLRRDPHVPYENLGILGHIMKIEFRNETLVTAELECFSITGTLNGSQSWREG